MSDARRPEPEIGAASGPFWEATRDRQLVLQWCTGCETPIHFPREACPRCLGRSLEFRPASGRGVVAATSTQHRPGHPLMADRVPYVVALVDLEEGARMMTNIVDCDPDDVSVGMAVEVTWEELTDGRNLPLFAPAS